MSRIELTTKEYFVFKALAELKNILYQLITIIKGVVIIEAPSAILAEYGY